MEHITKLMITPGRGRADEKIYGQFIEHLGSCINGGVYDPKSRFADENGYLPDNLSADGCHLYAEDYLAYTDWLREAVADLLFS